MEEYNLLYFKKVYLLLSTEFDLLKNLCSLAMFECFRQLFCVV